MGLIPLMDKGRLDDVTKTRKEAYNQLKFAKSKLEVLPRLSDNDPRKHHYDKYKSNLEADVTELTIIVKALERISNINALKVQGDSLNQKINQWNRRKESQFGGL